jgi:hypothetical protein
MHISLLSFLLYVNVAHFLHCLCFLFVFVILGILCLVYGYDIVL